MSTDFAPKPTVTSGGLPIAGQRLAVAGSVVKFAAFNASTNLVIVDVQGNDMYVTFDGRTPSSTVGFQLYAGNSYAWNAYTAMSAQFIQQSAAGTVDLQEFTNLVGVTQLPSVDVLKPKPFNSGAGNFTNLTVSGTSNLIGAVTLSSTLTVSGSGAVNLGSGTTTAGGNLAVTGTSTLTGNVVVGATAASAAVTIGLGGTGGTAAQLSLNGGSASAGGSYVSFQRGGAATAYLGNESAILSSNNSTQLWYAPSGIGAEIYTNAVLALTVDTSQNLIQASGAYHQFGKTYASGVVAATGTIPVKDSTGTVYNMLVHT